MKKIKTNRELRDFFAKTLNDYLEGKTHGILTPLARLQSVYIDMRVDAYKSGLAKGRENKRFIPIMEKYIRVKNCKYCGNCKKITCETKWKK